MLQTISLGSCVQVQGTFIKECEDGRITVAVYSHKYTGYPIPPS